MIRTHRGPVGMLARPLLLLCLVAGLLAVPGSASAQEATEEPTSEEPTIYPTVVYFPLIGEHGLTDSFGDSRGDHAHQGVDIMADKMTPVVAAAAGVVKRVHDGTDATCCALFLEHADGWQTWYIHLNNDTPGTDDGQGTGIAEGIAEGASVAAGQLIGWVGDSGNAEWTAPHLHFELRQPDGSWGGVALDAYDTLLQAEHLSEPLPGDWRPPFWDDEGSIHEDHIVAIYEAGVTKGCARGRFCPADQVERSQMAAFLLRALEHAGQQHLPAEFQGYFDDVPAGTWFTAYVEHLFTEEHEITKGCTVDQARYCPDQPVTRGEMAAFLVRAFELAASSEVLFADDGESQFEGDINAVAEAGITKGCNEVGDEFCPDHQVTRAQMASFLARALGLAQPSS